MNRKLILIVAGLLAFAVTAGTYAYTYSLTAFTAPAVIDAGGNIATFQEAAAPPEWLSILAPMPDAEDDFPGQGHAYGRYKKVKIAGEVPEGDLFVVTPHPSYTGDLLVRIYLTNTADLLKAYRYLSMKVYLGDSIEARGEPGYQLLSLENGGTSFNLEGGHGGSRTISVIGGSYRLASNNPNTWAEGWTVVPELFCEIMPR